MNDILINAKELSMSYRNISVLDHTSVTIHDNKRIAIVGRNGAGKSTLLKILQKKLDPDDGHINYKKDLVTASLAQRIPSEESINCQEVVLQSDSSPSIITCQNLLKAQNLDPDQAFHRLSGGQQRRLLLSVVMHAEPDVLFLDEPTNHLDIPTIHQLYLQLRRFTGTLVFVSHDRWLIEQLATSIIDLENGKLTTHDCNFGKYLAAKEEAYQAEHTAQSLRKSKLKREEQWLQRGVTGRRKRNQGRLTKLKELRDQYKSWKKPEKNLKVTQHNLAHSGKKALEIKSLSCRIGDKTLLKDFSATVFRGEKIGIIGPNAVGKTTLLKCLLGELAPATGSCTMGTKTQVAYFDQHRNQLDGSMSVQDNVAGGKMHVDINGKSIHVMQYLQQFLFSGEQARGSIDRLSGGERNRLLLAQCLAKPANLLILDEPTNDLDMDTLDILESFLVDYSGTLFVISHDQMFLDHIITNAWLMTGDQSIEVCDGNIDAWQSKIIQQKKKTKTDSTQAQQNRPIKTKLTYKQQQDLNTLPALIETAEETLEKMCAELEKPGFYQRDQHIIKQHQTKIKQQQERIAEQYARWEQLEAITNSKKS